MDILVLLSVAIAVLVVILSMLFYLKSQQSKKTAEPAAENVADVPRNRPLPARRGPAGRNVRDRRQRPAAQQEEEEVSSDNNNDEDDGRPAVDFKADEKMGAKKRAKLEAKAEKKVQRENEQRLREDKKAKEAVQEEERKKAEEKEQEDEKKREEVERLAREEKERKEQEEYLKMKAAFDIEEEGYDEDTDGDKENLLQEFVKYIKNNKVVVLEDLATHFKMKTQSVIDRITELKSNGTLTGVVDDRGKFIYISEIELQSVAKFIKQRGRVSISDLAESSNSLINLVPVKMET